MDAAELVVLQGPGGIGKTSLLLGWLGRRPARRPVAWLTVDVRDNDPARFWAHLAAALALALGELALGELTLGLAAGGLTVAGLAPGGQAQAGPVAEQRRPGSELFVQALAERIAACGHRPVLVLDELEQLTDARLHRQLDLLVEGCAGRLTTVVAGRVVPPLRLEGLPVAVLGPAQLRMDQLEAGRLLADGFGVRLPEQRVAALVRTTGGWAGALVPAAARLRAHGRTPLRGVGPEDGLPAGGAVFAEQLLGQVWSALDPGLREFLLDTAVLDAFDASLAAAVHPAGDAAELIGRLRRDGSLLASEQDGWFRYQRLFRWALAGRLAVQDPARERLAHRAAARWHLAAGNWEPAVDHCLRAGDQAVAVQLIEQLFDLLVAAGRQGTLERWLGVLSDEVIAAVGVPLADQALALWCALGRPDERDRWSRAAGRRLGPRGPLRAPEVWQLCLPRESGDLARALRLAYAALDCSQDGWAAEPAVARTRLSLARTLLVAGRLPGCVESAAAVLAWADGPGDAARSQDGLLLLQAHALLGLAAYRSGESAQARAQADLARSVHAACAPPPRPRAVPEYLLLRAAVGSAREAAELAELVDGSPGLGPDRTLAVFAQLVLARRQPALARRRLAAADAVLAGLRDPLGLAGFRADVAAEVGPPEPAAAGPALTHRELVVLQCLRGDLSPKEIADQLYISLNTVRTHARHAHRKL